MMNIKIKELQNFIKKRMAQGPIEKSNYISTILKNKRLMNNLTLHEATENICSEAFLSKVERNLMDPHNERVELLCERFDLNYNELVGLESNGKVEKLLKCFFKRKFKEILELDNCEFEDEYIAQDEIIKAYKAFINKDYKKLQAIVFRLDTIKQCLSDMELFALILIVYEYNFINLQYDKAKEYLHVLDLFKVDDKDCNEYIEVCKFVLSAKTRSNNLTFHFNNIRDNMLLYDYNANTLLTLYYFEALSNNLTISYIDGIQLNSISDSNVYNEIMYVKAKTLIELLRFDEAFELIKQYENKDFKFVTLFAYGIVKFVGYKNSLKEPVNKLFIDTDEFKKLKSELLKYIKDIKQEEGDIYNVAFLRLMQYELDQCEDEVIANYIKNYLLKELNEFSYPIYNEYIIDRYCELLGKLCRYKDAYNLLLKVRNDEKNKMKYNI